MQSIETSILKTKDDILLGRADTMKVSTGSNPGLQKQNTFASSKKSLGRYVETYSARKTVVKPLHTTK